MFIILLVTLIKGQVNWVNYSFDQPQKVPLIADETVFSRNLDEFGQILNYSIKHEGTEEICHFEYQYQYFRRMSDSILTLVNTVTDENIDNFKTEDIESGFDEEIVSYIFNGNSVMLLQTNGTLHEIYIGNYSEYLNYSNYFLTFSSQMKNSPQLLYENGAYYYVEGGEFVKFIINDQQIFEFPFSNWEPLYGNFKVALKNDYIYIINGRNGLIIYQIEENHSLRFLQRIEANDLYGSSQAMNLVDQTIVNDYLYILDTENGVIRFNTSSQKMDKYFFIPQAGFEIMAIKNNTILLSHSSQLRSITIEGVIMENSWYIRRKQMIPKQIIKKIMLFDDYAILMSNSKNHLYQTKLLENYTDPELLNGENFYSLSLIDLYELNNNCALGIFKQGIAVYYQFQLPAQLFCSAQVSELNKVNINITSTDCQTKNISSELTYCQSYLQYEFDIHRTLMSPWAEDMYIYMCIVSAAVAVALIASIFLIYRRYAIKKERIDELKRQQLRKRRL